MGVRLPCLGPAQKAGALQRRSQNSVLISILLIAACAHRKICGAPLLWLISIRRAGDQTANLWWQLRNGLLPRRNLPDAAVVMIGTNDLGFLDACSRWGADDLAAVPGIASRRAPPPAPTLLAVAGVRTVPFAARSPRRGLVGPNEPSQRITCRGCPEVRARWEHGHLAAPPGSPTRCRAHPLLLRRCRGSLRPCHRWRSRGCARCMGACGRWEADSKAGRC